ncbi:MAG: hypothetical protein H6747_01215 [Deltaproteobacteria bacterium]|nr:hypothetical protein [Deltaproteobacteria bacterium]
MPFSQRARSRVTRLVILLSVSVVAGCGVGYSTGLHNVRFEDKTGAGAATSTRFRGYSTTMSAHSITIYDESGALLAGAANSGRKYIARKKAEEDAISAGKRAGQSFDFTYRKVAPVAGAKSQISLVWGSSSSGTVLADGGEEAVKANEVSMVGFRFAAGLKEWFINSSMVVGLGLEGYAFSYSSERLGWSKAETGNDWSRGRYGTPVVASMNYRPYHALSVSATVGVDPLFSAFSCIDSCKLVWNGGFEANWRPLEWLGVVASGRHFADDDLDAGNRALELYAGVYLMWVPDFWRRAQTGNYQPD